MSDYRLLTFNWHETYLHMLAATGGRWDIVPREKGGRSDWWREVRPVPANASMKPWPDAAAELLGGKYDAVVCHNTLDLQAVLATGVPTITILHSSRHYEEALGLDPEAHARLAEPLLARTIRVFVSASKKASWGASGVVVRPGIDLDEYGGYHGSEARVLVVGNLKQELAAVSGLDVLQHVSAGLPLTLLGLNRSIRGARLSRDWDDLRDHFRSHRLYLNTTVAPYEDGYNLAMLEAMASGMPVVTLPGPGSPIRDGVNGYVSDDPAMLRERVLELLEDAPLARRLGDAARATVAREFPVARFREAWRNLIHTTVRPRREARLAS